MRSFGCVHNLYTLNMPTEEYKKELEAYKKDTRIACKYGTKCYQKNTTHHTKYKHAPNNTQAETDLTTGRKRTSSECEDDTSSDKIQPQSKLIKESDVSEGGPAEPNPLDHVDESHPVSPNKPKPSSNKDSSPEKNSAYSTIDGSTIDDKSEAADCKDEKNPKNIIKKLFLTVMPDDFYNFYDFCKTLSPRDPSTSLKLVDLKLVGPYDVLNGKIANACSDEPEKYLRHWRYYYDPPEFQTILKGNDKAGLHYGYWRDNIDELPVFVARNSANKDCHIELVAPNVFGAVKKHIGEKLSRANPFEKAPIIKLLKQLKTFAKAKSISLEADSFETKRRTRDVVAQTFHGAGVVVPYDTKTQLGYRSVITDSELKKILKKIDEAKTDGDRRSAAIDLDDVVRLATIAADESDFGTCLELGHDLFSSGVAHVQRTGLRMLATAYNLLNRKKFIEIAEAHAKDRKKGSDLDVS